MGLAFVKKPKFFIPVIGILAAGLVIFSVIRNMNQPAVGSINQAPQPDAIKADPYGQPGNFNGKYITFTYPAHFKKVPSKANGNSLEAVEYHSADSTGKLINVAVLPGTIDSDSGVAYRRQHPELYSPTISQKWTEFTKKDGTEDTFFINHNNLLATVSVTASYNNQSGDGLFIASSLKWR